MPKPDATLEAVLACASNEARRYGISANAFRESVIGTFDQLEKYERAAHRIERRVARLCSEPAPAEGAPLDPLPDPAGLDVWSFDPGTVGAQTRCRSRCPRCNDGEARNQCPSCKGSGVVTAWLELDEATHVRVATASAFIAPRLHPEVADVDDFDRDPADFPSRLEHDTGWCAVIPRLPLGLLPSLDPDHERIVGTRIQTFIVPIYSVTYKLLSGHGTVDVVGGKNPKVLPWANWKPLKLRITAVVSACIVLGLSLLLPYAVMARPGVSPTTVLATELGSAVAVATLLVLLFRLPRTWAVLRRSVPAQLGGQLRQIAAHLSGSVTGTTHTFGAR